MTRINKQKTKEVTVTRSHLVYDRKYVTGHTGEVGEIQYNPNLLPLIVY